MRYGILEAGRPPEALKAHGSYPEMVQRWLGLGSEARFYAALDGTLPASPGEADIWVLTGSRHAVYEDHAFIPPLEQFVRDCFAADRKIIGICFGHQLIAQAMGGKVERAGQGWGLGLQSYRIDAAAAPPDFLSGNLSMQAVHRDQVTRAPDGARIFARSAFCPIAALWYPGKAITFQGHPEFDAAFSRAVMQLRRGDGFPEEIVDCMLPDVDTPNNRAVLAQFVAQDGAW